jgi:hypothetical protein
MKTPSPSPASDVPAEVSAWLADLEFRAASAGGRHSLGVASRITGTQVMEVLVDNDKQVFRGRRNLRQYGIEDGSGCGAPDFAGHELLTLFSEALGRPPTDAENAFIAAQFVAMARASSQVAAFAAALDMDAMTAFGRIPSFMWGRDDPYTWICGSDPASVAMKRFVLRYPLLGGLATYEFAEGDTADEAYGKLMRNFSENGFLRENRYDAKRTGPIPAGFFARIEGVKPPKCLFVPDEEEVPRMADAVRLARRLPPDFLPATTRGWMALIGIGATFRMLTDDAPERRDVGEAIDDGYGCALEVDDADLARMFDPAKGRFDDMTPMHAEDAFHAAGHLARHGVRLAGHGDWLAGVDYSAFELPADVLAVDFSELKAALATDGFAETLRLASQHPDELDDGG